MVRRSILASANLAGLRLGSQIDQSPGDRRGDEVFTIRDERPPLMAEVAHPRPAP